MKFLDTFEVIEFLNEGADSFVYKLQHKTTKTFYALKEVQIQSKEELFTVLKEKNISVNNFDNPNFMTYFSLMVSTKYEELSKFHVQQSSNSVNKDLLSEYGIDPISLSRPSSRLTTIVDEEFEFQNKFGESLCGNENCTKKDFCCGENFSDSPIFEENNFNNQKSCCRSKLYFKNSKYFLNENSTTSKIEAPPLQFNKIYFHYLITNFAQFTLYDFIVARNNFIFQRKNNCSNLLLKMVEESTNLDYLNGIILNILNGLKYLKERNIIHNDICTRNIFFLEDLIPKIGDFGNVKFGDLEEERNDLINLGKIFVELLIPFETVTEKFYVFKDLKRKEFGVIDNFKKEKRAIFECFSKKPSINTIISILNED